MAEGFGNGAEDGATDGADDVVGDGAIDGFMDGSVDGFGDGATGNGGVVVGSVFGASSMRFGAFLFDSNPESKIGGVERNGNFVYFACMQSPSLEVKTNGSNDGLSSQSGTILG